MHVLADLPPFHHPFPRAFFFHIPIALSMDPTDSTSSTPLLLGQAQLRLPTGDSRATTPVLYGTNFERPFKAGDAEAGDNVAGSNGSVYSDHEDTQSILYRAKKFWRRRFWWFCLAGVFFMIVFELSFLPRTSLARDFRRWYKIRLTKADVKRDYLDLTAINHVRGGVTTEESLMHLLGNFSRLNANAATNLCAQDNIDTLNFVESRFKRLKGFKTTSYLYDTPQQLATPRLAALRLRDEKGAVLYDAKSTEAQFKTPAYYAMTTGGAVYGHYVFVNEGTREDFERLLQHEIDPTGQAVIVRRGSIDLSVGERVAIARSYGVAGFVMYNDEASQLDENVGKAIERNSVWDQPAAEAAALVADNTADDARKTESPRAASDLPAIPISFDAVLPILNTLYPSADTAFESWPYHPSPASSSLFLELESRFEVPKLPRRLTNVIAEVKGILNDGEVVIGASRDSFTASNPLSGHAVMLEIMRGFQGLMRLGWKPLRPIKFVSWDGTHNGLLGSNGYFNDSRAFDKNMPVVGYIHIDGDAVTGSRFEVDANPSLNHLVKGVAQYVPIPLDSAYYRLLMGDTLLLAATTSLFHYWKKQDNNTINPILGDLIKGTDALNFQQRGVAPVVNVKFSHDRKRDALKYTPNSNYYLLDWLIDREIDRDMVLHGLLVRYLGLLTISLAEHEVTDRRLFPYVKTVRDLFHRQIVATLAHNGGWLHRVVPSSLLAKSNIVADMDPAPLPNKAIKLEDLVRQFNILLDSLIGQLQLYDEYNRHVAKDLITDYAWYHSYMKLKHYAQFKLANYKLLRLEHELTLSKLDDFAYLFDDASRKPWLRHVVYGLSRFDVAANSSQYTNRDAKSVFAGLQHSLEEHDFNRLVRWMVVTYAKLKGWLKKME